MEKGEEEERSNMNEKIEKKKRRTFHCFDTNKFILCIEVDVGSRMMNMNCALVWNLLNFLNDTWQQSIGLTPLPKQNGHTFTRIATYIFICMRCIHIFFPMQFQILCTLVHATHTQQPLTKSTMKPIKQQTPDY